MPLRLILGRAGSGKSTRIEEEITRHVEADPLGAPIWVLVPEQATFQVERALSDRLGGLMRVRVVSFQRLAHIVMNAVAGAALTPIGDLGRLMLMRKVIEEHKQELRLFGRAAQQPMFAAKVVQQVSELKRYRITPAALSAALSESLPTSLRNKLHDLHLLYSALSDKYSGVALDSDDRLEWLDKHLSCYRELWDAELYIDGFTGFTPQEDAVLGHLFRITQATLSLTLDPGLLDARLDPSHPFFTTWETANHCRQLARRQGAQVGITAVTRRPNPLPYSPLAYLEANYFDLTAQPLADPAPGLALVAAETRRAEVEYAARAIIGLCREHNLRYRDIAVTARNLSLYEPLLAEVFPQFDIPYFLDKKRPVRHHPLLDLITAALEALEQGFPYEPTLRCLKTDLWPLARDIVDRVDNFALATGIRGSAWTADLDWRGLLEEAEQLQDLNAARRVVAAAFSRFDTSFAEGKSVRERAEALLEFLAQLGAEEKLQGWAKSLEQGGDVLGARVHLQVWQAVDQLLAELVAALGDEVLPLADFRKIIVSGCEGILLGLVPPCLDQVLILELGRSRNRTTRAGFLLGVNEGVLPARPSADSLLTDEERAFLSSFDIKLGPTAHRKLFEEEFLVYVGLTRSAERLTISYALTDEGGGALRPSPVVRRLQQLFLQLKPEFATVEAPSDGKESLQYLAHPVNAAGFLAAELRKTQAGGEVSEVWGDVYNYLQSDERSRYLVQTLSRGLRHRVKVAKLPRELVHRLYGKVLRGSVSRLEKYRACPFAHFAYYGLKLRERSVYKLAAVDIGNFFHLALDGFVSQMQAQQLDWAKVTRAECKDISRSVVDGLVPKMGILTSNARHRYLTTRLQQVVERSARVMGEHARRGKFRPVAVELGFGKEGDSLPAVKIELADGAVMELSGRIDRVDTASEGNVLYAMVVDYKSGVHDLTPLEAYYGLRTQLLTYLWVVLKYAPNFLGQAARPAAAVYFRVQDPVLISPTPLSVPDAEAQSLRKFRLEGMVLADKTVVCLLDNTAGDRSDIVPVRINANSEVSGNSAWTKEQLEAMLAHLMGGLAEAGQEIMSGSADVAPFRLDKDTACTYCPYLAVCQFDALHPDSRYRRLEKYDNKTVWSFLGVKGGENRADVD